jgi:hypothetical protein
MIFIIIIIIIIIISIILFIRINREYFWFRPDKNININVEYPELIIDNHYAIYNIMNNTNKCMLISHGNSSNIYNNSDLMNMIKKIYDGDIYCYEYPGFGKCKGKTNVNGCVNEHLFWLNYLSKKYNHIDLWGYSIGGGVIAQSVDKIPDDINKKIHKIYFHNTFSIIENVFKKYNIIGYYLYKLLLINDSHYNTLNILSHNFFKNKEIIILHSLDDEVIPYNEALLNYNICKQYGYNIKLINLEGNHMDYILNKID